MRSKTKALSEKRKPKMTLEKFEKTPEDRKMDRRAVKAINKKRGY